MFQFPEFLPFLEKANHVAQECDWQPLSTRSLELAAETCLAEAALLNGPVMTNRRSG